MAGLSFISDPSFYYVAVPAVLLLGLAKSGFGSGFGALAVPLMAMSVSVPKAAAILMPLLFAADMFGLGAFRKDFDKRLLLFLLPFGLAGIGLGALTFGLLDSKMVAGIVGALTLLFLAQRLFFPPAQEHRPSTALGALLTIVSGFTSFTAHSGSAPLNAYLVPLRLNPVVFAATSSYFFTTMNLSKWIPYAWLGLFDRENIGTSLALLPLIPVGVLVGIYFTRRVNQTLFFRLVYAGMFITGCKLIYDSF